MCACVCEREGEEHIVSFVESADNSDPDVTTQVFRGMEGEREKDRWRETVFVRASVCVCVFVET